MIAILTNQKLRLYKLLFLDNYKLYAEIEAKNCKGLSVGDVIIDHSILPKQVQTYISMI